MGAFVRSVYGASGTSLRRTFLRPAIKGISEASSEDICEASVTVSFV